MPRLTNAAFYEHYASLYYLSQRFPLMYEVFSLEEAQMLNAYFGVSNQMTKEQAVIHRGIVDKYEPTLAAQAGKLYNRMYQAFEEIITGTAGDMDQFNRNLVMYMRKNKIVPSGLQQTPRREQPAQRKNKKTVTKVSVTAERREEVDWDKYAYATLQYAKSLTEKERKAKTSTAPPVKPSVPVPEPAASPKLPPAKPGQQALL